LPSKDSNTVHECLCFDSKQKKMCNRSKCTTVLGRIIFRALVYYAILS
jgi:hypothetical protein